MHQGGGRDLPAVAILFHQELGRDLGIGEEHLVERGVAVHLTQGNDFDARLAHFEDEVGEALVLGQVDIRARQQQAVVCAVRARGPHLLSVDHPSVAAAFGPGHGARKIGAAARFAEQLAPRVLARKDAAQELLFVQIGAVRQDRRRRQRANAHLRDTDRAGALEFLIDHRHQS